MLETFLRINIIFSDLNYLFLGFSSGPFHFQHFIPTFQRETYNAREKIESRLKKILAKFTEILNNPGYLSP